MSDLHYPDLHIQGFRGIKELSIPRLGRVTLITGKNNTGKSSVLEALRLHTQHAAPQVLYDILTGREEYFGAGDEYHRPDGLDVIPNVSPLFHGFPKTAEDFGPISISATGKSGPMELDLRLEWFVHDIDSAGDPGLIPREESDLEDPELVPQLTVKTESGGWHRLLNALFRQPRARRAPYPMTFNRGRMPCIFVSPYTGASTDALAQLWDSVSLTENESDVVEALRIVAPEIAAVTMVGGEGPSGRRTAMVRSDHIARPVPLRSFGDGINRLFSMALSLVNARGGVLLIDEFENGLHYSVQLDAWRMIFQTAAKLDVQVFATTHSWDAITTFQNAAAESPEEGMYLRLTRRHGKIFLTDFTEHDMAVVARHKIEVR